MTIDKRIQNTLNTLKTLKDYLPPKIRQNLDQDFWAAVDEVLEVRLDCSAGQREAAIITENQT